MRRATASNTFCRYGVVLDEGSKNGSIEDFWLGIIGTAAWATGLVKALYVAHDYVEARLTTPNNFR